MHVELVTCEVQEWDGYGNGLYEIAGMSEPAASLTAETATPHPEDASQVAVLTRDFSR